MRNKKVWTKVLACCLATSMLLTGCGSNGGGETTDSGTKDAVSEQPAAESTVAAEEKTDSKYAITLEDLKEDLPAADYDYYSRDTLEINIMTIINDPYSADSTLIEEI